MVWGPAGQLPWREADSSTVNENSASLWQVRSLWEGGARVREREEAVGGRVPVCKGVREGLPSMAFEQKLKEGNMGSAGGGLQAGGPKCTGEHGKGEVSMRPPGPAGLCEDLGFYWECRGGCCLSKEV